MGANIVNNPDLNISTSGNIQVYDSMMNLVTRPGGNGIAPDNYWYLGGPDYPWGAPGTFADAGGVWDPRTPIAGHKSIMLDAADPRVRASCGLTQVIPLNQVDVKTIKFSAYAAAENCNGNPKVLFDVIGFGDTESSGSNITFDTGTYDFCQKKKLFVPTFKVRYAFLHLYAANYTTGKAWFSTFTAEELPVIAVPLDISNRIINPNFTYTDDDVSSINWTCVGGLRADEATPVGNTAILLYPAHSMAQDGILVDTGYGKQRLTVYAKSTGVSTLKLTIRFYGRYRNVLMERVEEIDIGPSWDTKIVDVLCSPAVEKAYVKIENGGGDLIWLGGATLVKQDYTPINPDNHITLAHTETIVTTPEPKAYDDTMVIDLPSAKNVAQVTLNTDTFDGDLYLCSGSLDRLEPTECKKTGLTLLTKLQMNQLTATEYGLSSWSDEIEEIWIGSEILEAHLRIPHVTHPDYWLLTTGGSIPADTTYYYCVTSVNGIGESTRSNEVRAITSSSSNANRVPIEICPVEDADSYRIYRTQVTDPNAPWIYGALGMMKGLWTNTLVAEISAATLRDSGYIYYDTGTAVGTGTPPTTNLARRWRVDTVNDKVVFDKAPSGTVYAAVKESSSSSRAIKYMPHSQDFYLSAGTGLFKSDTLNKTKLYRIVADASVIAFDYYNEFWYMTSDGTVHNLTGTSYAGAHADTEVGFAWTSASSIARFYSSGSIRYFDLSGNVTATYTLNTTITAYKGLFRYFDKLVTLDTTSKELISFTSDGTVLSRISSKVSECNSVDISGTTMTIHASFAVVHYKMFATAYYGDLESKTVVDKDPQYPSLPRPRLPGELVPPLYPELLSNGTFENGTTFPAGFNVYGDTANVTWAMSTDSYISGTKALSFHFKTATWGSINKYKLSVIGGRWYVFSAYLKSTASTGHDTAVLGVAFKNEAGVGSETFYTVTETNTYTQHQTIVQAPIDAVTVDFRFLNYGSSSEARIYHINGISVKEQADQSQNTDELLFNGDFALVAPGNAMPSGWHFAGDSPIKSTTIELPVLASSGHSLAIEVDPWTYGWVAFESENFPVVEGDVLKLTYFTRQPEMVNRQHSLYLKNADNSWSSYAWHPNKTGPISGRVEVTFPVIPAGVAYGIVRIWPNYGMTQHYEGLSVKPTTNNELLSNPTFTEDLSGWSYGSYLLVNSSYVPGMAVTIDTVKRPGKKCAMMTADRIDHYYTQCKQTISLNQSVIRNILIQYYVAGDNVQFGVEFGPTVYVEFMDGTGEWNPASIYALRDDNYGGSFDWTLKYVEYVPPKAVKTIFWGVYIANWWSEFGPTTAWISDFSITEKLDAVSVDGIQLTVPYTVLNTETITQVNMTVQLTYQGVAVDAPFRDIVMSSNCGGTFTQLKTNSKGKAKATYSLPDLAGPIILTASYGGYSDTETIILYPLVIARELQRTISPFANGMTKFYIETKAAMIRHPVPTMPNRIGVWQVFTPAAWNTEQTPDYQMHYSPESSVPEAKPEILRPQYPSVLMFHYFDYLSDYPYDGSWQEIMKDRKEWFCVSNVGLDDPFGDSRYYYNWRDAECSQWYIDKLIGKVYAWAHGIYIDDFWGEAYDVIVDFNWAAEPCGLLNFKSKEERVLAQLGTLQRLQRELHKRGLWLTTNYGVSRRFDWDGDQQMLDNDYILSQPFDGFLLECWLYTYNVEPWDITNTYFDLTYVHNQIEFIKWTGEQGKWVVALPRCQFQMYGSRMFSLASFLMGKHDMAYYYFSLWGPPWSSYGGDFHTNVLPELKIYTGAALENYQLVNGLFSRRFDNCVALVNMSGSTKTYTLPAGTWYTMRGDSYTGTISILNKHAFVLVKIRP